MTPVKVTPFKSPEGPLLEAMVFDQLQEIKTAPSQPLDVAFITLVNVIPEAVISLVQPVQPMAAQSQNRDRMNSQFIRSQHPHNTAASRRWLRFHAKKRNYSVISHRHGPTRVRRSNPIRQHKFRI